MARLDSVGLSFLSAALLFDHGLCLQTPPTPPVDPENEEFVIFVKSTKVRGGPPSPWHAIPLHQQAPLLLRSLLRYLHL
jgi:hypothetical protein